MARELHRRENGPEGGKTGRVGMHASTETKSLGNNDGIVIQILRDVFCQEFSKVTGRDK
jgi:hypothetical protein